MPEAGWPSGAPRWPLPLQTEMPEHNIGFEFCICIEPIRYRVFDWFAPPLPKGQNPERKRPFHFQNASHPRRIRNVWGAFSFGVASPVARWAASGLARAPRVPCWVKATAHAARAHHWLSKWVRAKVRIRSEIETSSAVRGKFWRAKGARLRADANSCMRVRANWEGGHGCKK